MPSIPTSNKMFFCRVTTPPISIPNNLFIKTKFYTHQFTDFFYVHEHGHKTEKPHYHLLIICKTTKQEITKWIKDNFKVKGNEQFSVSDKYEPESRDESLIYMLKGGLNELQGPMQLAPETLENLKENYKNLIKKKQKDIDLKFEHYYNLIEKELKDKFNHYNYSGVNEFLSKLEHQQLFKIIYKILIKDAINRRTLFRRNIVSEHAFVYTCHFASPKQLHTILEQSTIKEIDKHFEKPLD